jgi:hypothetical protein
MMQTSGCSICMKVCPVQRYGLRAVLDEYRRSGQILGKDTDDLEGFDWPLDGRQYGPNEKPHVPASVVRPLSAACSSSASFTTNANRPALQRTPGVSTSSLVRLDF